MTGLYDVGRRGAALAAALVVTLAGCERVERREAGGEAARASRGPWSPTSVTSVRGVPVAAVKSAIASRLEGQRPTTLDADQWGHVRRLYRTYGGSPLWLDDDGLHKERGEALMRALIDATSDGLRLDAYGVDAISRAVAALRATRRPEAQPLADLDVLLTSAYAALGEDLLTGQIDPRSVSQDWHIDASDEKVDSALVKGLGADRLDHAVAQMRPQDPDYEALRRELARFRQVASRGPWPQVPEGRALKRGESDSVERLAALRARLAVEGLLPAAASASDSFPTTRGGGRPGRATYDATLAAGVAAFQARHGINVDSILGTETADALNVPASFRLAQIAANLERYRWLPRTLGSRYILVNVPAFRLEAYDEGRPVLDMKVIVGADYVDRKTPVFSDSMETVVFRPYWLVTDSIASKEVWPKIQADPGYMDRNDYETYQDGGKTRIRQRPGPKNSLGLVKFLFPNSFNIYLHDTPEDRLFEKDVRAFSHGCIRVEKPAELAAWVLGWPIDRVQSAMQEGSDNRTVRVPRKLPVYIAYFTTYTRDGQLYFGNDLYGRDDALVATVAPGLTPSAEAVRATETLRRYLSN